jgi:hypothetical protein
MAVDPVKVRRKKYAGYNTLYVIWHESIAEDFDIPSTLKALAEAHGLLADEKRGKASNRMRIDTVESSRLRGRRQPVVDREFRQDAAKLLRRALKDPRSAERIRSLVERARLGEDVDGVIPDAIDPDR